MTGEKLSEEIKDWARQLRELSMAVDGMHRHAEEIAQDSGVNVVDARDVLEMTPAILALNTDYDQLLEAVAAWLEEQAYTAARERAALDDARALLADAVRKARSA